ncbi:MAG: hypothetical protein ACO22X_01255 [Algoriphagus sp.]
MMKWIGKEWVGLRIQVELKIYPCMDNDSCQNCPFQTFGENAPAILTPIREGKLKPMLEIGKIISEAIDIQFYWKKIELSIKVKQKPPFIANSLSIRS